MKKQLFLFFVVFFFFVHFFAQNTYNLDPTSTPRFTVTDKVWPSNIGEGDVCLWKDDKMAAFTVTIDDNNEQDISFWETMITEYGFNFTWFVITEAASAYNVSDWQKFRDVAALGSEINGHDDRNWYDDLTGGQTNPTDAEYYDRLLATQTKINAEITGNCLTYAYPFGEGNEAKAREVYIAIRGVTGVLNHANTVNYIDVNSVSSSSIYTNTANRDTYILPLMNPSATLFGVNYYRGWGSTHFHSVGAANEANVNDFLQYLEDKPDLWVAGFTQVSQYSQSFATHILTMDSVSATEITFTLIDDMLNAAFDMPLSVKVRIDNNWLSASATQNGQVIDTQIITNSGNKFALIAVVPDNGQVTLTGTLDTDPAVITTIDDSSVEEDNTLQIDFSAATNASDAISFTIENLPSFGTLTDNDDNTGNIVFNPATFEAGVFPNVTLIADNGRSTTTEVFQLTVTANPNVVTVNASNQDASVYYPVHGFVDPNNRTFAIAGGGYVANKQMSAVFPFQLPALPSGKEVISAKFIVNLESFTNNGLVSGDIDLYGLPHRTTANVVVNDGYSGAYNNDATATGLQQNFANKLTQIGEVETSSIGNTSLVSFLNTEYQSITTGDYLFLRLSNDDVAQNQYGRTLFSTADGATTNGTPYPRLLIQFGEILGVKDTTMNLFHLYPNPITNNILKIATKDITSLQYSIYTSTGNLVKKGKFHGESNTIFSLPLHLDTGLYFIRIQNGKNTQTQKLVVK